eukprot:8221813-Alexandrium_andersonii.AAC.1
MMSPPLAPPTAARAVLLVPGPPPSSLLPPMAGVMARPEAELVRGDLGPAGFVDTWRTPWGE